MHRRFGWIRDTADRRDLLFTTPVSVGLLPSRVNLTRQCCGVVNQGALGSCTACAIGSVFAFEQKRQGSKKYFYPSRLFIYYNERAILGTINEDSGAMIRDGMKSIVQQGVCPEIEWPYIISAFKHRPSARCYTHAKQHQALKYLRLPVRLSVMKQCLAAGYPFVFGFTVYTSFMTDRVARGGHMPIPKAGERILGGHAVYAMGYDDAINCAIVRNSWGRSWGDAGNFYMPYAVIANPDMCADFWSVRLVERS